MCKFRYKLSFTHQQQGEISKAGNKLTLNVKKSLLFLLYIINMYNFAPNKTFKKL